MKPNSPLDTICVNDWLQAAATTLSLAPQWQVLADESPRREAEWLLADLLAKPLAWLLTWGDMHLSLAQQQQADAWLQRRCTGEPLAYITGEREFWSLTIRVTPATLVPRPDSECLVEAALEVVAAHFVGSTDTCVLDLGTGSGAIALALASELNKQSVLLTAVDRSEAALVVARSNGDALGLPVRWLLSDWFSALKGEQFHLIVSNPPYIDAQDPHLQALRYEPVSALVAEQNGMADLLTLIREAPEYLALNAWLLLEHGHEQAMDVRAALLAKGFTAVKSWRDLGSNERVSGGRWPGVEYVHAQ